MKRKTQLTKETYHWTRSQILELFMESFILFPKTLDFFFHNIILTSHIIKIQFLLAAFFREFGIWWCRWPDSINNECTLYKETETPIVCVFVCWNGIVSNNQTVGKLNHLAHLISASALFCAFSSNSYCEPNCCCVGSKHKHFLFRTLQLPIQHRGVVPFSSLVGTLMPEESWERICPC